MGGRWGTLLLFQYETLRCDVCDQLLYDQKVHLYLDVNDELDEVMCDACWKEDQKEEKD